MFTKDDLFLQLRALGIQPSDTVLIHTSMRAIGAVEGGADGVIEAFCVYLTDGLFLVPTHTWNNVCKDQPVYDVRKTPPCIGAIPQAAAFRRDGVRSLHPTHSLWAHGRNAEAFVRGEELAETPAAPGFAWSKLADMGAKILLIGVGNDKNTFIHAIEELADIPDRLTPEPFEATIVDYDGTVYRHPLYTHYCSKLYDVSRFFVNFEKPLVELGAQTYGTFGNAQVRVVDAALCRDIILRIFSRTKDDLCLAYQELPKALYK